MALSRMVPAGTPERDLLNRIYRIAYDHTLDDADAMRLIRHEFLTFLLPETAQP